MNRRIMAPLVLAMCGMLWATTATATSLTFNGPVTLTGTGIGAANTILTLQTNNTSENGSVSWDGSSRVISGDAGSGASQSQALSIGNLNSQGINASNLGVILQVNQTGQTTIDLHAFSLQLWSAGNGTAGSSTLLDTVTFTQSGGNTSALPGVGVGTSGYLFTPDSALSAAWSVSTNRVGLVVPSSPSGFTNNNDGPETFFLVKRVPEPSSMVLLGTGLFSLGLVRRRWRSSAI